MTRDDESAALDRLLGELQQNDPVVQSLMTSGEVAALLAFVRRAKSLQVDEDLHHKRVEEILSLLQTRAFDVDQGAAALPEVVKARDQALSARFSLVDLYKTLRIAQGKLDRAYKFAWLALRHHADLGTSKVTVAGFEGLAAVVLDDIVTRQASIKTIFDIITKALAHCDAVTAAYDAWYKVYSQNYAEQGKRHGYREEEADTPLHVRRLITAPRSDAKVRDPD